MSKWKEGDRVAVIQRPVTDEDRKKNRYFEHMAGLVGSVQNVYDDNEVAVRVEISSATAITQDVHKIATQRMRDRFLKDTSEEQKKQLTKEEMDFVPNYVLLVNSADLVEA